MRGLLLNYQFGMWDAVLKGIKTNTRRCPSGLDQINKTPGDYKFIGFYKVENLKSQYAEFQTVWDSKITRVLIRNKPGDYAYLQEPVLSWNNQNFYKYTDKAGHNEAEAFKPLIDRAISEGAHWENKYFMAEQKARYFVKFIDVKVERLQDISIRDCLSEGIQTQHSSFYYVYNGVKVFLETPQKAYFYLYNQINGITENNNPWVFSYHFELCEKPNL